jgi:hypothetical protein
MVIAFAIKRDKYREMDIKFYVGRNISKPEVNDYKLAEKIKIDNIEDMYVIGGAMDAIAFAEAKNFDELLSYLHRRSNLIDEFINEFVKNNHDKIKKVLDERGKI